MSPTKVSLFIGLYEVKILKNLNLDFVEIGGDSSGLKLISFDDNISPKTNILQKALKKYLQKLNLN